MAELRQNFWPKYGFRNNPYDTNALTIYSDAVLPIQKAYVGRESDCKESQIFTNILRSSGGNRVVVEGEIGVGKTTFVNYHRYLWEKEAIDRLFTPSGEISFSNEWNRQTFLAGILSHITTKLYLLYGVKLPKNDTLFQELLILNKVFVEETAQWQIQAFGFGAGWSKDRQICIPAIPEAKLLNYFRDILLTILDLGFSGIILHLDNLELMENISRVQQVLEEIRDLLQIPNVYYIFVAKTGFFSQVISPLERVRSIFFGWPVFLKPLSSEEALQVFHIRYELLASQGIKYIKPVEDSFILYLYQLYEGKIRFIMDAIHGIVTHFPVDIPQTVPLEQSKTFLRMLTLEKIRNNLSERELQVLLQMTEQEEFSNLDLSTQLDIQKQNMSKYMKKLLNSGYIRFVRQEGRKSVYVLSPEILYLHTILQGRQRRPTVDFANLSPEWNQRQREFLTKTPIGSYITTTQYATQFNISRPTAFRDIRELEARGVLKKSGRGRNTVFELMKK